MMKITGLSHLFKWENLHNWWLTKYFFAPLYVCKCIYVSFQLIKRILLEKPGGVAILKEYGNWEHM